MLGFIKNKVLKVAVLTRVGESAYLLGKHRACEESILGEILVVTSAPSATVQVCAKAIGTVHCDTLNTHLFTVVDTKAVSERFVPGLSEDRGAGEACSALRACVEGTHLRRTVVVGKLGLANRWQRRVTEVTCVDELHCFGEGDLTQNNIPKRMVIIRTEQKTKLGDFAVCINQCITTDVVCDAVIFDTSRALAPHDRLTVDGVAKDIRLGIIPLGGLALGVLVKFLYVICHLSVGNVCNLVRIGEGYAADEADILTAVTAVEADAVDGILTRELIGYGISGLTVDKEIDGLGYVVSNNAVHVIRTACKIDGFDVVGVGHQLELIRTCIKLVALVAVFVKVVCIVASEVLDVHGDSERLLLAGVDDSRFCKSDQADVRLLDLAVLIFGREIDLNHILTRDIAYVRNRHRDDDLALTVDLRACGNGKRVYRPLKRGIGKSKSKGILHNTLIAVYSDLAVVLVKDLSGIFIPYALNVGSLIPFITKVNTLDVIDECRSITARAARVASGTRGVHIRSPRVVTDARGARAFEVDVACHIISVGIGKATGRRNLSPKHSGDRLCGTRTGSANDQAGVNAGYGIDKIELHRVGGVDNNDNVLKVFANILEHLFFLCGDLEIMAARIHCGTRVDLVLYSCRVLGLTCVTTDDNEYRVGIILCLAKERGAVIVGVGNARLCKSVECVVVVVNRANVAKGGGKFAIHGDKALVIGDAVQLQSFQKVDVLGGVVVLGQDLTRSRTAVYPVDGSVTKHVDL